MFAPVIGAAYTMTTKREAHWSEQTKAQNTEKGMYVGLKQPRGDGERYVTPARAAAKETTLSDDDAPKTTREKYEFVFYKGNSRLSGSVR